MSIRRSDARSPTPAARSPTPLPLRHAKSGSLLPPPRIHPPLQNKNRSHPVHSLAALLDRQLRLPQKTVRLRRRQPLIPQMNRQTKLLAQLLGKPPHLLRLRPLSAAHAQRQSDDDLGDLIRPNHAPQVLKIVALISPLQR